MLKTFVLLLLLLGLNELYADNGWSEPVLIYDNKSNMNIELVTDKLSNLNLFWHNFKSDTGVVMQSVSLDAGVTWSIPENLSQNLEGRYTDPQAVFDSENNLHIAYSNFYGHQTYYRKKTNNVWSEEILLEPYITNWSQLYIDHNDRIYLFGGIQDNMYYKYYDNGVWTQFKAINDSLRMYVLDAQVDNNNNLHCVGISYVGTKPASYLYYNKEIEKWIGYKNISTGYDPSSANDIELISGHNNYLETVISAGGNSTFHNTRNETYHRNSICYSGTWSEPVAINDSLNEFHKRIIIDQNNQPHIFDLSADYKRLYHFYLAEGIWQSEIIFVSNEDKFILGYSVLFTNNIIQLVLSEGGTKLLILNKTITTSIGNFCLQISDYELFNYPNPFNNNTKISFILPRITNTKLAIFNAKGELVQTLFTGKLKSGNHSFNFNATGLNSGVYYCRLTAGSEIKTTKLMLLK